MSQWERHGPGGALASAPPVAVSQSAARAGVSAEAPPRDPPSWEHVFRSASPTQQADLLRLAAAQGLVYGHQLPPANGADRDAGRAFLAHLLAGETCELRPVSPVSIEFVDGALDAGQRAAVTKALSTPDLCLIQGLPGTGKSRVAAEIVLQAVRRGERVLLLAPVAAAVDCVLERIGSHEAVCAVRCLHRDERTPDLPPAVAELTLAERLRRVRENAQDNAAHDLAAAEQSCRQLEDNQPVLARLEELADHDQRLNEQLAALRQRRADTPEQVHGEALRDTAAAPAEGPFARELATAQQQVRDACQLVDEALVRARAQVATWTHELGTLTEQVNGLRPDIEAKQQGRWWSLGWWRCTLGASKLAQWQALSDRQHEVRAKLAGEEQDVQQLNQERANAEATFLADRSALVERETARRQAETDAREATLTRECAVLAEKWQLACRDLKDITPPTARTIEAIRETRQAWSERREGEASRLAFVREWLASLDTTLAALADRFPGYVNLVAGTTASIATDTTFGDASPLAAHFDLLVLDASYHISDADFANAARRARRWVLMGETTLDFIAHPSDTSAAQGRTLGIFARLWNQLHLPQVWLRESDRLCCRLRPLCAEHRRWIETESLSDAPNVELRILTPPRGRPELVEVVFPPATSIGQAKQLIFRELNEMPVGACEASQGWLEEPDRLVLRLAELPLPLPVSVPLAPGVLVKVSQGPHRAAPEPAGAGTWRTCCVEFDRKAGWSRAAAETWVERHLGRRDLGRTAFLEVPYRMRPDLAAFLSDWLFRGAYQVPNGTASRSIAVKGNGVADGATAAVEFVPVPTLQRDGNSSSRPARGPAPARGQTPARKGGAGLELNIAEARQRERLPAELRPDGKASGLANLAEAQAIVAMLERWADEAVRHGKAPAAHADRQRPAIGVIALYPAQVELIRRVIQQSPRLGGLREQIKVGTPTAFAERECQTALISLTRSHTHRAVSFGDGPRTLTLALTRARTKLILFGDPGTLARRTQWEGPLDHLDGADALRERYLVSHLVEYLQGRGPHRRTFQMAEGRRA